RAAVADTFDEKNDGRLGISGPQKVSVQRVHKKSWVDSAYCRHQRLAGHMTAERSLPGGRLDAGYAAPIDVDLELLEIEDLFDRHETFLPAAAGQPLRCGDLLDVDTDHRLPQAARDPGQHIGVV